MDELTIYKSEKELIEKTNEILNSDNPYNKYKINNRLMRIFSQNLMK